MPHVVKNEKTGQGSSKKERKWTPIYNHYVFSTDRHQNDLNELSTPPPTRETLKFLSGWVLTTGKHDEFASGRGSRLLVEDGSIL